VTRGEIADDEAADGQRLVTTLRIIAAALSAPPPGCPCTTAHQNTHLSMLLKREETLLIGCDPMGYLVLSRSFGDRLSSSCLSARRGRRSTAVR